MINQPLNDMSPVINPKEKLINLTTEENSIKAIIRRMTREAVQEIGNNSENNGYLVAFSKYTLLSKSLLKPYKHHLGMTFDAKKAEGRFKVESVLLRLISEVTRMHIRLLGVKNNPHWPIDNVDNIFSWYH